MFDDDKLDFLLMMSCIQTATQSFFSKQRLPIALYTLLYYCRPYKPFLALTGLVDTANISFSIEPNTF